MASSPSSNEDARLAALMVAVDAQVGGGRPRLGDATPARAAGTFGIVALAWVGAYVCLAKIASDEVVEGWGIDPVALGLLVGLAVGAAVLVFLFCAFIVLLWRARQADGDRPRAVRST